MIPTTSSAALWTDLRAAGYFSHYVRVISHTRNYATPDLRRPADDCQPLKARSNSDYELSPSLASGMIG
jgi:hypothetical protein